MSRRWAARACAQHARDKTAHSVFRPGSCLCACKGVGVSVGTTLTMDWSKAWEWSECLSVQLEPVQRGSL